jgi:hypothetical protein
MPTLTHEAWAQIRADYEHSERPIADICAEHGISSGTLRDRMRRWEWTRRRPPIPLEGPPPLPALRVAPALARVVPLPAAPVASVPAGDEPIALAVSDAPAVPVDLPAPHVAASESEDAPPAATPALIAQRLQGAVARVLPAIEATLGRLAAAGTHPREMDGAARALAALTRTLRELNALLVQHPVPADEGPDNLDDFRREFAARMDAVIAARRQSGAEGA